MKPEQQALLHKAQTSLDAAQLLLSQQFYDFAVSRAYYTMFYIAAALLLEDDLAFSKHSAVIAAFGQHFAKIERAPRKFHRYLIQGMDSRNVGDYDTGTGLSMAEAKEQIAHAEEFLAFATQELNKPKPPNA
jgi:uncharacterized protein (UPF0332 family)